MSEYTIESGIEMPPARGSKTAFYREPMYLLLKSNVGDSVWIKAGQYSCTHIQSAIGAISKRAGARVVSRKQIKGGEKGVRVWYLGKR